MLKVDSTPFVPFLSPETGISYRGEGYIKPHTTRRTAAAALAAATLVPAPAVGPLSTPPPRLGATFSDKNKLHEQTRSALADGSLSYRTLQRIAGK